ncbi:MAG TPA: Holliday junction branch migration protein RuvA [Gemmatimonadales bacterium]|nr:Holliday junction branch migration protein RuvA [Gemmatimonadales bacterium]
MIALITGTLVEKSPEAIVIQTDGGVGYAMMVPLGVFERLPAVGSRCTLHTELVVREDGWLLFGFDAAGERTVFQRLLTASGFGPRLALAVLSTLGPDRTVRSIRERDLAALSTVSGVGKKKAERLVLELHDRFTDVMLDSGQARPRGGAEAVRALEALGYTAAAAEEAIRTVLEESPGADTAVLVRRALQQLTGTKGGRR